MQTSFLLRHLWYLQSERHKADFPLKKDKVSKLPSVVLPLLFPHLFSGHSQQQPRFLGPQYPLMANVRNFLFSVILLSETPPGFVHSIMDYSLLTNVWRAPLRCFLKFFYFFLSCSIISETFFPFLFLSFVSVRLTNLQITAVVVAKINSKTIASVYQE